MTKARGGSTRRWREVRATVLLRDAYRCRLALPGEWRTRGGELRRCTAVATEAHHIHGYTRCHGCRVDALDHLQAACRACNLRVGDPGRQTVRGKHDQANVVTRW